MSNQMIFQRYEIKYLMTRRQQEALLAIMRPYMVPDAYSHSSIRNLYLDTPDYRLIRRSLEKPVYKEKVRVRSYGSAGREDPVFVELKVAGGLPLWMAHALSRLQIFQTSFSKYGLAYQMMCLEHAGGARRYA